MKRFKGQTVIITDADSSIGKAIAMRFADEGANIVLIGQDKTTLINIAESLPHDNSWIHDSNYLTITCDIDNQQQVEKMLVATIERFEAVHILVNTNISTHNNSESFSNTVLSQLIKTNGCIVNVTKPNFDYSIINRLALEYSQSNIRMNNVEIDNTDNHTASYPLKQQPKDEDIADVISFLSSDDARMLTGNCLKLDAGKHLL